MKPENIHSAYFIGIGGIGMSALAQYFSWLGITVSGYDRTPTALTARLIDEGIPVHYEDNPDLAPETPDLVIYTPAIPPDHLEFLHYKKLGLPMKKRAEVLGWVTAPFKTIAVAGTHGKTTTSSLIAHILYSAGFDFLAFLGGIARNYGNNFVRFPSIGEPSNFHSSHDPKPLCVVEADEYDRSFLQLAPYLSIVTSTDPDHLDVYGNTEDLKRSFEAFTSRIAEGGKLIIKQGVSIKPLQEGRYTSYSYSVSGNSSFHAENIRLDKGLFQFDFIAPDRKYENFILAIPGLFNLENAVAALSASHILGVGEDAMKKALQNYQGVQRRFDFRIRRNDFIYIDDYAHHPEELRASIGSVRAIYPEKKITGIFQPHLFSRTRDMANEFARSLEMLDELYLLEIYPAREKPMEGVDSSMLFDLIGLKHKTLTTKTGVLPLLLKNKPEILMTLGAGDIDQLIEPIMESFGKQ